MKKNFLQDVVPHSQKRSIRDIPLPSHRTAAPTPKKASASAVEKPVRAASRKSAPEIEEEVPAYSIPATESNETSYAYSHSTPTTPTHDTSFDEDEQQEMSPRDPFAPRARKASRGNGGGFLKKLVVSGLVLGLGIGLIFAFGRAKAEITIYPKQDANTSIDLSIPVNASTTLLSKTQISKTASVTVQATSEQQVEQKASGKIKIINTYGTAPQALVANTRFQTPEGLVYRIKNGITVPAPQGATPGTLEVEVYADTAGAQYNIAKTKFTIPGFQGEPQFDKITAESVTDMTGGFVGIKKVISDEAKKSAVADLQAQIKSQFDGKPAESDATFIIPSSGEIAYGEVKDEVQGNSIVFTLSGTADAWTFKKQELADFIGRSSLLEASSSDNFALNLKNLAFGVTKDTVTITGTTDITWLTDIEALKNEVASKKRSEITQVLASHKSILKADMSLKPFWRTKFPSDASKISVNVAE